MGTLVILFQANANLALLIAKLAKTPQLAKFAKNLMVFTNKHLALNAQLPLTKTITVSAKSVLNTAVAV